MSLATRRRTGTPAGRAAGARPTQPRRAITWRAAFVLSLGGALLVVVALGPMAAAIGAASLLVWGGTVAVGALQCLLLAELASRFPQKVGGAPAYTHEGFRDRAPLIGAVAAWGYWVAWIPGVAVNLLLAATYLEATFLPGVNVLALAGGLALALYALAALGLRPGVWLAGALAVGAIVPLAAILIAPLARPATWRWDAFAPLVPAGVPPAALAKWAFVAAWSSYGAELAATVVGEMRDPQRDAPRAVGAAAAATALAFVAVPALLLGIVGVAGLAQDPALAFLTAAAIVFGPAGARVVGAMLIAALVLGAQVFIIGSSRALYQMSRDGLIPPGYGRLNRRGVPVGSVGWDAAITAILLAAFGTDLVRVVAAANVGYLVVFTLLPLAYVRARRAGGRAPFQLPGPFVPIALALAAFNALLLAVGGAQWGGEVVGLGAALPLSFLPLALLRGRRRVDR